jgi:hypothetical protein
MTIEPISSSTPPQLTSPLTSALENVSSAIFKLMSPGSTNNILNDQQSYAAEDSPGQGGSNNASTYSEEPKNSSRHLQATQTHNTHTMFFFFFYLLSNSAWSLQYDLYHDISPVFLLPSSLPL